METDRVGFDMASQDKAVVVPEDKAVAVLGDKAVAVLEVPDRRDCRRDWNMDSVDTLNTPDTDFEDTLADTLDTLEAEILLGWPGSFQFGSSFLVEAVAVVTAIALDTLASGEVEVSRLTHHLVLPAVKIQILVKEEILEGSWAGAPTRAPMAPVYTPSEPPSIHSTTVETAVVRGPNHPGTSQHKRQPFCSHQP